MQYLICGFMGAGKTHSLSLLKNSNRFENYHFVDLDGYIIEAHPEVSSVADLIKSEGLERFRQIESTCLSQLLSDYKSLWVSLGGGTRLTELGGAKIYWLDTDFELCWERIKNDNSRPLVKSYEEAKSLYNSRLNDYRAHPCLCVESFFDS